MRNLRDDERTSVLEFRHYLLHLAISGKEPAALVAFLRDVEALIAAEEEKQKADTPEDS